jgi:uncharacterized protein (TIGR02284 family)
MDRDKVIDTLNDLIEICEDGKEGFRQAAENVKSGELKTYFDEVCLIRARMAGDLQAEVIHLGANPNKQGSVSGALHRAWFDFKSKVSLTDESVLASVESGEDAAVKAYEKALKADLPDDLIQLIQQQFNGIKAVHARVKSLRDSGLFKTKTA